MTSRACPRCGGELRFDEAGEVTGCSSGCALFLIRGSSSGDRPAEARRFLCRFGSAVAWLQQREDGRLATVPLDRRRMVRLLARSGRWLRVTDSGATPIPPPREVADDLLVDPDPPLPRLERIVEV